MVWFICVVQSACCLTAFSTTVLEFLFHLGLPLIWGIGVCTLVSFVIFSWICCCLTHDIHLSSCDSGFVFRLYGSSFNTTENCSKASVLSYSLKSLFIKPVILRNVYMFSFIFFNFHMENNIRDKRRCWLVLLFLCGPSLRLVGSRLLNYVAFICLLKFSLRINLFSFWFSTSILCPLSHILLFGGIQKKMILIFIKCGSLDVSQPYRPSRPITGIALPFRRK
jgi:hypothetical protein